MTWKDIVKNNPSLENVSADPVMNTKIKRVPKKVKKDDCNRKLKQVSDYIKGEANKMEAIFRQTILEINKNDPPKWGPDFRVKSMRGKTGEVELDVQSIAKGDWRGEGLRFEFDVSGSWNYKMWLSWEYNPIPEEYACLLIDMFNDEKATDLNGHANYNLNTETSTHRDNPIDGIMADVKRYAGTSTGYRAKETYIQFDPRGGQNVSKIRMTLSASIGYPYSHEIYDNVYEHMKMYREAVNWNEIHERVAQIMRS